MFLNVNPRVSIECYSYKIFKQRYGICKILILIVKLSISSWPYIIIDFLVVFVPYCANRYSNEQLFALIRAKLWQRCCFRDAHVKFAISRLACHDGNSKLFYAVESVFSLSGCLTMGLCSNTTVMGYKHACM